jgi:hypothetical protein
LLPAASGRAIDSGGAPARVGDGGGALACVGVAGDAPACVRDGGGAPSRVGDGGGAARIVVEVLRTRDGGVGGCRAHTLVSVSVSVSAGML